MGTSHSHYENGRNKIHSSSKTSKRAHSVGGTYKVSTSSSNTKAASLPVGNQYNASIKNPKDEYYATTSNTVNMVKIKNKQEVKPPRQNNNFARRMSESKLPHRIPLQHKHTSDITYEKVVEKENKGTVMMINYQNSLIESKSSMRNDTYVVEVKTPRNQNGSTIKSNNKLASNQSRQKFPPKAKDKKENCQQEANICFNQYKLRQLPRQSKARVSKNPYANQYGSFY